MIAVNSKEYNGMRVCSIIELHYLIRQCELKEVLKCQETNLAHVISLMFIDNCKRITVDIKLYLCLVFCVFPKIHPLLPSSSTYCKEWFIMFKMVIWKVTLRANCLILVFNNLYLKISHCLVHYDILNVLFISKCCVPIYD